MLMPLKAYEDPQNVDLVQFLMYEIYCESKLALEKLRGLDFINTRGQVALESLSFCPTVCKGCLIHCHPGLKLPTDFL